MVNANARIGATGDGMKACKHLDYTTEFTDCTIQTCAPHFPEVRYWLRGKRWESPPGEVPPNPLKVQFCGQGRGRINGIFQCYQAGEMGCYEPAPDAGS